MKKILGILLIMCSILTFNKSYLAEAYDSKDFKAEFKIINGKDEKGRIVLDEYAIRCNYPTINLINGSSEYAFKDIDIFVFENDSVAYFYVESDYNEDFDEKFVLRADGGISSGMFMNEKLVYYGAANHLVGGASGLSFNYSSADLYNAVMKSYDKNKTCPDLVMYHTGTTTQVGTIYYGKEENQTKINNSPRNYSVTEGTSATLTYGSKYTPQTPDNPSEEGEDTPKEPEIKIPKETSACPEIDLTSEYQYQANLRDYISKDISVKVRLLMKDDGRKYAEIVYGNDRIGYTSTTREIKDDEGVQAKINGSFAYVCLKKADIDWIFSQNETQKKNNTFTCDMTDIKVFSWDDSEDETTRNSVCLSFQSKARIENDKELKKKSHIISDKVGFCVDYLGSAKTKGSIANFLDRIYTIIKVGAVIIAIILSMMDLVGTITSGKAELKPVFQKIIKRVVVVLVILLLPTIIDIVFGLFGYKEVLCGIR